ncbi:hypothetical protein GCM10022408_25810 [Hymenobacter fastidiosus]|uniref:Transposase Helix-turn-helix domain-containing protein n=1 Tax=Hymenobacter fastidiosus TaxID=486264 RepID=A0ABP7SI09_9BACT
MSTDYLVLRERPRRFPTLSSLLPADLDELLTDFAPAWERYHRYHTLDGAKRRLPAHAERANATLAGSDTKLFLLLTYLKSNRLQRHQAASFGVSQTRVSRLATALPGGLNHVPRRRGRLPVRDGPELTRHPDQVFACDGVGRGVPRNTDGKAQAEEYSAKKAHRLKNVTLCDDTQHVYFLSATEGGWVHDKKMADEYALHRPAGSVLRQDLGLLGHAPAGVRALTSRPACATTCNLSVGPGALVAALSFFPFHSC